MNLRDLHAEKLGSLLALNVTKATAYTLSQHHPERFESMLDTLVGYLENNTRSYEITKDSLKVYVKTKRHDSERLIFAYTWLLRPRLYNPLTELEVLHYNEDFERMCWLPPDSSPIVSASANVWSVISEHLDVDDLYNLRHTCKDVCRMITQASVWEKLYYRVRRNLPPRLTCAFAHLPVHVRLSRILIRASTERGIIAALNSEAGQIYAETRGAQLFTQNGKSATSETKRQRTVGDQLVVTNYEDRRRAAKLAIGYFNALSRGIVASIWVDVNNRLMTFHSGMHHSGYKAAKRSLIVHRRMLLYGRMKYK
jgi:hypothetical protein